MREDIQDLSGAVAEMTALRHEISDHSRRQGQLIMLSVVCFVVANLLSCSAADRRAKRSTLIYPLVATFLAELCYDSGASIQLIAQYIEDRLEPKLCGTGWEKWLTSSGVNDPIVSVRLHRAEGFFVFTQCASICIYATDALGQLWSAETRKPDLTGGLLFVTAVLSTLRTVGHDVPLRDDAKNLAGLKNAFAELMGRVHGDDSQGA